jgi:hypothetical protein
MESPIRLQTDAELLDWDWRAELARVERSIAWLARQTGTPERTAYAYSSGTRPTSVAWLRKAAQVLGKG